VFYPTYMCASYSSASSTLVSNREAAGSSASIQRPDLSIIVVNYNVRDFLEQSLRSIQRACRSLETEIIVVDNNSIDGSVEMVRDQFPGVQVLANTENVGFSSANNQAIRRARGRYLLIINPDTIVQEDTLTTLVEFMDEHPRAGAVGCQILNPDGTFAPESRRSYPTPSTAFYRMTGLSQLFPDSERFGRYNMSYLPEDQVAEVDALSGSCMMVRHTALYYSPDELQGRREQDLDTDDLLAEASESSGGGAGLLDEDFFMYGEDLDWCYRIKKAGWKILYTPDTQIIHYKGESTKKGEFRYIRLFYRAMIQFTRKHFSDRYSRFFALLIHLGILVHAGITLIGGQLRRLGLPLADFALSYGSIGAALFWFHGTAPEVSSSYLYGFVTPLYALITVGSIAAVDTYRRGRSYSLQGVFYGAGLAFIIVTFLSYYVDPFTTYPPGVPLIGFAGATVLLLGSRWILRHLRQIQHGLRRAVMVGHPAEAERLSQLLDRHPRPAFKLVGYVDSEHRVQPPDSASPRQLGYLHHLRDLVRLREIDDVIFAANGLSNRVIFQLMQQLRTLPVQFQILVEGREHLIGKASIDDLSSPPLVSAREAVGPLRSRFSRRSLDISLAAVGLLSYPVLRIAVALTGGRWNRIFRRLLDRITLLPAAITGKKSIVGYTSKSNTQLPVDWNIPAGVFSIVDAFAVPPEERTEVRRAYWFYARNQSVSMDLAIVYRAVKLIVMDAHA
jgi:GT2 family glycosyltransferase